MAKLILFLLGGASCLLQVLSQTSQSSGLCLDAYRYYCVGDSYFRECSASGPTGSILRCNILEGGHTCYPYKFDTNSACGSALPQCTSEGSFPILKGGSQKDNCKIYQLCSNIGKVGEFKSDVMECRPGAEFSKSERKCVNELYADCSIPYVTTVTSTTSTTPMSTTRSATTYPPPKCPLTGQAKLSDQNDCRYYYTCNEGNSTRKLCPLSMLFNEATVTCSSNVDCGNRYYPTTIATTTTPVPTKPPPTCPATGNVEKADPNDCRYFYSCSGGISTRKQCPLDRVFDEPSSSCVTTTNCGDRVNPLATTMPKA